MHFGNRDIFIINFNLFPNTLKKQTCIHHMSWPHVYFIMLVTWLTKNSKVITNSFESHKKCRSKSPTFYYTSPTLRLSHSRFLGSCKNPPTPLPSNLKSEVLIAFFLSRHNPRLLLGFGTYGFGSKVHLDRSKFVIKAIPSQYIFPTQILII